MRQFLVSIVKGLHFFVRHELQRPMGNAKHSRNETLQTADKENQRPTYFLSVLQMRTDNFSFRMLTDPV